MAFDADLLAPVALGQGPHEPDHAVLGRRIDRRNCDPASPEVEAVNSSAPPPRARSSGSAVSVVISTVRRFSVMARS